MVNHKHTWMRADQEEDADRIFCINCGIDYDEWYEKMKAKGYTEKQMERFENQ
jgi:hypothetical protein